MSDTSEIFGEVRDTKQDRLTPKQAQAYINTYRKECESLREQVEKLKAELASIDRIKGNK